jgi:hypothetical protein
LRLAHPEQENTIDDGTYLLVHVTVKSISSLLGSFAAEADRLDQQLYEIATMHLNRYTQFVAFGVEGATNEQP